MKQSENRTQGPVNRRSFLKKSAMAAGAATAGAMLLSRSLPAFGQDSGEDGKGLTQGDIAILRFLAAAELIEADLGHNMRNSAASPLANPLRSIRTRR